MGRWEGVFVTVEVHERFGQEVAQPVKVEVVVVARDAISEEHIRCFGFLVGTGKREGAAARGGTMFSKRKAAVTRPFASSYVCFSRAMGIIAKSVRHAP